MAIFLHKTHQMSHLLFNIFLICFLTNENKNTLFLCENLFSRKKKPTKKHTINVYHNISFTMLSINIISK